jgi:hypothetical protein
VWVEQDSPNEDGYWLVVHRGDVRFVRYAHVVSVAPVNLRISSQEARNVVAHKYFSNPSFDLHWYGCQPDWDGLPEMPKMPGVPDDLRMAGDFERIFELERFKVIKERGERRDLS